MYQSGLKGPSRIQGLNGVPARIASVRMTTERRAPRSCPGLYAGDVGPERAARKELRRAVAARVREAAVDVPGELPPEAGFDRQENGDLPPAYANRIASTLRVDGEAAIGLSLDQPRHALAADEEHSELVPVPSSRT